MVIVKSIVALAILLISPLEASNRYRHHDSSDVVIRGSDLKHILRNLVNSDLASTLSPEERKTAEYKIIVDASKTVAPTAIIEKETKNELDSNENDPKKLSSKDLKAEEPDEEITIVSSQAFEKPTGRDPASAENKPSIVLDRVSKKNKQPSKPWVAVEENLSLKSLKYKKLSQINK